MTVTLVPEIRKMAKGYKEILNGVCRFVKKFD
jgi:hypothetical protein